MYIRYIQGIYTVLCALCTIHGTLYSVHCALCTVHHTRYTVLSALCTIHGTLYSLHYTRYTVLCALHSWLFALLAKADPKLWFETKLVEFDPKGVFSFRLDGESQKNEF